MIALPLGYTPSAYAMGALLMSQPSFALARDQKTLVYAFLYATLVMPPVGGGLSLHPGAGFEIDGTIKCPICIYTYNTYSQYETRT